MLSLQLLHPDFVENHDNYNADDDDDDVRMLERTRYLTDRGALIGLHAQTLQANPHYYQLSENANLGSFSKLRIHRVTSNPTRE